MRMMVRKLLLDRYDANHDHLLDGEEHHRLMEDARAARQSQAQAFIRRFDADGDGKLNPEERNELQQAMKERRRSGKMEKAGAPPPIPPHHHATHRDTPGRRHHEPHPHMGKEGRMVAFMVHQLIMDAYDTDKNGELSREEASRLKEDGTWLYQTREAALLERYDSDKDGKLSDAEAEAAIAELMPQPLQDSPAGAEPPPLPPRNCHRHSPINRLLDTHFDIDILINLTHPQVEESAHQPCSPSTPLRN